MNHLTQLSPLLKNASPEMQSEVMMMINLSIQELLVIANAEISETEATEHEKLLERKQNNLLTSQEQKTLIQLRQQADQLMLKKAYAWAILKDRGYSMPHLTELT